jgi:diaminopimelate epimerase
MEIKFIKMNGAGNDFILIDSAKNKDLELDPILIKQMCDRRKGVGSDGILYIKPSSKYDFELEYYNSDGSLGSLCGNGARCSIKYAIDNLTQNRSHTNFLCNGESFSGSRTENGLIKFNLLEPDKLKLNLSIQYNGAKIISHFLDTGSPHVVIFWDEISKLFKSSFNEFDMTSFGRKIRNAREFYPDGTNVNVIHILESNFYIRTYERGVEDETLACGTGTVAAAIISNEIKKNKPPLTFKTFGNDELIVDFNKNNEKYSKITLTGPAKINYIGHYNF